MLKLPLLAAAIAAVALVAASPLLAGPDDVKLPENYQSAFTRYMVVDHLGRNRARYMYVNLEADQQAKPGEPLPDGTILIMEDHDAQVGADGKPLKDAHGRIIPKTEVKNIFVMEKNSAWSTDNGNWDYAWHTPDGKLNAKFDKYDRCFSCHTSQVERDFNFPYSKHVIDRAK